MKRTQLVPAAATYPRKSCKASVVLLAALAGVTVASADQRTWEGNGSVSLTDAANFAGGVAPVSGSDGILFNAAGSQGASLTLDSAIHYFNSGPDGALSFSATASTYTIGGAGQILMGTGGIVNNSAQTQTFTTAVRRNGSGNLTIGANSGALVFGNTFSFGSAGGSVGAAFGTTTGGLIRFGGNIIVGSGTGTLNLLTAGAGGAGTVEVNGSANTGLNAITISAGNTLKLGSSTALDSLSTLAFANTAGSAPVTVVNTSAGAISTAASLLVNSTGNLAFGQVGNTSANSIAFTGATTITRDISRTVTISGTGVTVSTASQWNNMTPNVNSTLTVDGAGNTFKVASVIIAPEAGPQNRSLTVAGTGNLSVGVLTNSPNTVLLRTYSLNLTGSGVTTITGDSNWGGTTTVGVNSTLLINGSHTNGLGYTVNGLLGGTGIINPAFGAAVTLSETGRLQGSTAGDLYIGANLDIKAALAAVTPSMLFTLSPPGTLMLGATSLDIGAGLLEFSDFTFTLGEFFDVGIYTLFYSSSVQGSLGSNLTGTIGAYDATLSLENNRIILTVIPEPSTYAAVAGLGVLGLAAIRRRRKAA